MTSFALAKKPLGFRAFFLLAAYSTVFSMLLWGGVYAHGTPVNSSYGMLYWHSHEMIFGFTLAIIAGFLLTAVQNWTGIALASGIKLAPLIIVWLAGRIVPFLSLSPLMISIIDLSFIPLLMLYLAPPLIKAKKFKNLVMLVLLALLFVCNLFFHLELLQVTQLTLRKAIFVSVDLTLIMICIISGRIIPFFTGKVLDPEKSVKKPVFEILSILSILLLVFSDLHLIEESLLRWLYIPAAIIHLLRIKGWYQKGVAKIPVLFVLYTGYSWLIIGFVLKGLSGFGIINGFTLIHAFTSGCMGVIILAMISRVSLGHTGRKIKSSKAVNVSFIVINLVALVRVFVPLINESYYIKAILWSSSLWVLAFLIFSCAFTPILLGVRADGEEG
ncbi:NnrS family protein [Lentisphaera profundi]|uniref:NnrS family protein n=1 Tax=Lentisphaera profundi TaxID=1658616 RepID=A0ABY7VYK4_9BACT|nr:NnrS family protein [Lentisphaera profundi]WDE99255.1 NnrS family protein [Lentisphaera profundi]